MIRQATTSGLLGEVFLPAAGAVLAAVNVLLLARAGSPVIASVGVLAWNGLRVILPLGVCLLLTIPGVRTAARQRVSPATAAGLTTISGAAYLAQISTANGEAGPPLQVLVKALVSIAVPFLGLWYARRRQGQLPARLGWVDLVFAAAVMMLSGLKTNQVPVTVGARPSGLYNLDAAHFVWIAVLSIYWTLVRRFDGGFSLRLERRDVAAFARSFGALLAVLVPIAMATGFIPPRPYAHPAQEIVFAVTYYTYHTAFGEELCFRLILLGWLFEVWARKYGERRGALAALLVTSAIFGVGHLRLGAEFSVLAFIAGLGYGWAFLATGRLSAPVLVHGFIDVVSFLFQRPRVV